MDTTTVLGSALNQLGQTIKQTAKQTIKIPEEMGQSFGEQVNPTKKQNAPDTQNANASGKWKSNEERERFLRDLYGSSEKSSPQQDASRKKQTTSANPLVKATEKPTEFQEQIADKSPEEQKKLLELRDQLHKDTYYDPTFNRPKSPPAGGKERPAEKVENEKKQEMQELQKKEEKKAPPLAVQRERNKAEMFRGPSG